MCKGFVNVELVVFYALLSNNNEMNSETTSFPESLFFSTSGRIETLETRLIPELIGSCGMLVQNFAD